MILPSAAPPEERPFRTSMFTYEDENGQQFECTVEEYGEQSDPSYHCMQTCEDKSGLIYVRAEGSNHDLCFGESDQEW